MTDKRIRKTTGKFISIKVFSVLECLEMLDGGHVARLVVFASDDPRLVPELPLVLEVNILALGVSHAASQGVEDSGPGTQIPLLDHRGVDVDILMTRHQLPDLRTNVGSRLGFKINEN